MAWSEWKTFGGGLDSPTLLWTNPNPDNSFQHQTLNIEGLSDYEYIMIETYGGSSMHSNGITPSVQIYKNNVDNTLSAYYTDTYYSMRLMQILGDTITFHAGYLVMNANANASYCIPYKIYGI